MKQKYECPLWVNKGKDVIFIETEARNRHQAVENIFNKYAENHRFELIDVGKKKSEINSKLTRIN